MNGCCECVFIRMVPTSVERLREGQGALERVLRGNLNIERALKRADAGMNDQICSRDKSTGMNWTACFQ